MTAVDVLNLSLWLALGVGGVAVICVLVWGIHHLLACTDDDLTSLGYDDGSYGGAAIPAAALLTTAAVIIAVS